MKPLYLNPAVHAVLPDALRPGGLVLTKKLTELINIKEKSIVDVGCGNGVSLDLLARHQPKQLIGLDIQPELLNNTAKKHHTIQGDMANIPLKAGSMDLVIAECAWNMSSQQQALAEFHRILRPQGALVLSDIYRRATPEDKGKKWPISCCFVAAKTREEIEQMLSSAGFVLDFFTDHSKLLKESAARFIFHYGSLRQFWQAVCGGQHKAEAEEAYALARAILPGLFFLLARKKEMA